jgi:hypothetical protein
MPGSSATLSAHGGHDQRLLTRDWHREIPVRPFQRRLRELTRQGFTVADIARNVGWLRPAGGADTSRLLRAVGLEPYRDKKELRWKRTINPAMAKQLAEAMHCDPVDLGF